MAAGRGNTFQNAMLEQSTANDTFSPCERLKHNMKVTGSIRTSRLEIMRAKMQRQAIAAPLVSIIAISNNGNIKREISADSAFLAPQT